MFRDGGPSERPHDEPVTRSMMKRMREEEDFHKTFLLRKVIY